MLMETFLKIKNILQFLTLMEFFPFLSSFELLSLSRLAIHECDIIFWAVIRRLIS